MPRMMKGGPRPQSAAEDELGGGPRPGPHAGLNSDHRGEHRGEHLSSDALNDLADRFASGELTLDDAALQDRFDTAVTRATDERWDDIAEARGITRDVSVTDDTLTVSVSGERGSKTTETALDLDGDQFLRSFSALSADGDAAAGSRAWSYDADGFTVAVTADRADGESYGYALDFDLDDRLLTVTETDGDVAVYAFDDVDAAIADAGGVAALIGIPERTPLEDASIG